MAGGSPREGAFALSKALPTSTSSACARPGWPPPMRATPPPIPRPAPPRLSHPPPMWPSPPAGSRHSASSIRQLQPRHPGARCRPVVHRAGYRCVGAGVVNMFPTPPTSKAWLRSVGGVAVGARIPADIPTLALNGRGWVALVAARSLWNQEGGGPLACVWEGRSV